MGTSLARSSGVLGAIVALALTAGPALASGQLLMESEPAGAQVFLDGHLVGQTPLLAGEVADGPHAVVVRQKGYRESRIGVRILRDLTTRKHVRLSAKGADGELRVTSEPEGAQVFMDGQRVGTTPLHLEQVRAGAHVLSVHRPGFRDRTQRVRVVADLTTSRELRLERQPKPPVPLEAKPLAPVRPKPQPPGARLAARPKAPPQGIPASPLPTTERPRVLPAPPLERPVAPEPPLPWKHMAFYGLMGMFLALLVGKLWQSRALTLDWQEAKPMARFQPLTPGRVPMTTVECCLRAIRLVQAGQADLGAEVMLGAYRQAPGVQMTYNLAIAWHLTGSPLAETAYRTAIQLDPAHRDARFNLAKYLTDSGRPYEALLAYRELVAAVPSDGAAWFNLGTLSARLGMAQEAVTALRRARRLLGDDVACRHNLKLAKRLRPWWHPGRPKPLAASSG